VIAGLLSSATMLASVGSQAEDLVRRAGYAGLTVGMIVENLFPPIPSELVLPLAGYEVSRGQLGFAGAVLAATLGSLIGALLIYSIGRLGGQPLVLRLHPLLRISEADLERAEQWFGRRGDWIVLGARLVPGARSLVSVPAGMLEMPLGRFSVLTALGSLVWNAALIAGGRALGANWQRIGSVVGPVSTVIVAVGVLGLIGLFFAWRRSRSSDAAALP
jgi:membrane protein DedA with SNARE-associated domain